MLVISEAVLPTLRSAVVLIPCDKNATSLTLPNTGGYVWVLGFPSVVTLEQEEMSLTGPLGRTV
jgi:hypothetical protein